MPAALRHAIRGAYRSPAFAATTIVTLGLGIGANTGAFSALSTLLLKPLPYPEPQQLVALYETTVDRKPRDIAGMNLGGANLLDWRRRSTLFAAMAGYYPRTFGLTLTAQDQVIVIDTGMVMGDWFGVVNVPPARGRVFTESEEVAEAGVMVLTDRLWRLHFASDPAVTGRKVFLNEEPYTVLGVMPPGFEYPIGQRLPDAFIPLSRRDYGGGRSGSLGGAARLKPGVSLAAARAELESVAGALAREYPATNGGRSAGLKPLAEQMTGARRQPLYWLLSAAALLLLIACANVAGLILARCFARSHETAIRAALGAGAGRLARQFLMEGAVLGGGGAACGLLAAGGVLRAIPAFIPGAGKAAPLQLDLAAFGVALALGLGVTLLLGLVPMLLWRRLDLYGLIKAGGRTTARGSPGGPGGALVVTQVALSVVLLLTTGLLLRSFLRLLATSPGFETVHALEFGIGLPEKRYDTSLKLIAFHRQLLERLAALPGVQAAGAGLRLPLRGAGGPGSAFQIVGQNLPLPERPKAWVNAATPGYFAAMGIPLLEGRTFSWQDDRPGLHRVAVVNQSFARVYLGADLGAHLGADPGANTNHRRALGSQLEIRWVSELNPAGSTWEVVGVIGDTRQEGLEHDSSPEVFLSMTQAGPEGAAYVIRTRGDNPGDNQGVDPALARAIAEAVAQQDPRIQRVGVKPLSFVVEQNLGSRRAAIWLVGGFGGLALLLTAIGIYGSVAFRAAERGREMAIRMALGATAPQVRNLVLGHGMLLAVAGTGAGLAAFPLVSRSLASQLYGVSRTDPATIAVVAATVILAALVASVAPSRRAQRTSPMDLLRDN
ncbi:MAG TPA: ADOP family duplicated permease [Candidatus Acidoferrales bacterium]|nr:ADOP family duplicated permease [Candidatus Acidoferrales bacterium]